MIAFSFSRNRAKLKKLLGIRARLALLALILVAPLMLERARSLEDARHKHIALAYSGIRAKLVAPGQSGIADFVIARDENVPRAIQLIGIESPGLTSSLAIAEQVVSLTAEILT